MTLRGYARGSPPAPRSPRRRARSAIVADSFGRPRFSVSDHVATFAPISSQRQNRYITLEHVDLDPDTCPRYGLLSRARLDRHGAARGAFLSKGSGEEHV